MSVVAAAVLAAGVAPVLADDAKSKGSPWEVFKFGFSAYQKGDKQEAVEAYRYAAENGQIGAQWKLGRMYADGDGVERNDYAAYKVFRAIASMDVAPGSPDESYVSDALLALGRYVRTGIPGSPVKADPVAAQDYYMRAAAGYGNADAQFEIGQMFLAGSDGVKKSARQAGQWLQLAADKGHAGAQAVLGNLLFQRGRIVKGLAMMTAAMERANPLDQQWIRAMQEEAFALTAESDRRTAIAMSQGMLSPGR